MELAFSRAAICSHNSVDNTPMFWTLLSNVILQPIAIPQKASKGGGVVKTLGGDIARIAYPV